MSELASVPLRTLVDVHRKEIKAIVMRNKGTSVAIFGSVARGDDTPDSDIDFLVHFADSASLLDQARIGLELERLLGRHVDVVSAGALLPEDDDIRRDAVGL